jgi:hypothetical protein
MLTNFFILKILKSPLYLLFSTFVLWNHQKCVSKTFGLLVCNIISLFFCIYQSQCKKREHKFRNYVTGIQNLRAQFFLVIFL